MTKAQEIINVIQSIKPIEHWHIDKKDLIITFEEELYLYEIEKLNHYLLENFGNITQENLFVPMMDSEYRKVILRL